MSLNRFVRLIAVGSTAVVVALLLPVAALAAAPANTGLPTISGSAFVGSTLTGTTGTWANSPTSYSYQWQRCGYKPAVMADAPVGYWRMGDPIPSVQMADSSGNGNTGTYKNGPTLGAAGGLAGDSDTAVSFNGTNQYATVPNSTSLNSPSAAITLEAVVKPGTISGQVPIVLKSPSTFSDPYYQYGLFLDTPNAIRLVVAINGGLHDAEFYNVGWVANAWNHIVAVYGGGVARIYLNGTLVGSQSEPSGTISQYSTPLDIGAYETQSKTAGNVFPGVIDEVAVYSTALSATRVGVHSDMFKTGCSNISGATTNQYTLASGDQTYNVALKVTATNADGSASATSAQSSAVAQIPVPQNTAAPVISGTPAVGKMLTTSNGSWNYASTYTYQWQRCDNGGANCVNVSGSNTDSYVPVSGDVGSTVRSVVTATNTSGSANATSAPSPVILQYAPPLSVSLPTVVGFVDVGSTLTTDQGIWSSADTYSVAVQWQRCSGGCSDISGATGTSYQATAADLGTRLRVKAVATNASGGATTAYSNRNGIDYESSVLSSSPTAYWRLNEASGATATDDSGNGFNGVYPSGFSGYGATGAPLGTSDAAVNATGLGTRTLSVPYDARLSARSFSLETWVNLSALPGDSAYARLVSTCGGSGGFNLDVTTPYNSVPTFGFTVSTNSTPQRYIDDGTQVPETGRWYYVAATYDDTSQTQKLYVNGVQVTGRSQGNGTYVPSTTSPLNIGDCNGETGGIATAPVPLHGVVDEVAYYSHVLTASEVAEHATAIYAPAAQTYGQGELAVDPSGEWPGGVGSSTGNFYTKVTDISMPEIGSPFEISRSYNSADTTVGAFGRGWTFNYGAQLLLQGNGDIVARAGDGQQLYFRAGANGTYLGDPGARATLTSGAGGYTLSTRDETRYVFDSAGKLTAFRDNNNEGPTFAYDSSGHLSSVTDSGGRVIAVSVDPASGQIASITLPDNRHVNYGYTNGLLTSVTDLRGGATVYSYDSNGRLTTIVDQNNHTVLTNTYDGAGRVTQQVDALNHTRSYGWEANTQTATYTDARNNVWTHIYSNNALLQSKDPLGNTTTYGYASDLNTRQVTDPRGNVTSMMYDGSGNILSRTLPDGSHESWTYDSLNDVLSHTNARGYTTSYTYDAAGNKLTETDPGGSVTHWNYDPAGTGLLFSKVDPLNKTTSFGYDTQGNLTSITSPLNEVTTMAYDATGRMLSKVDPRGNIAGANPNDYRVSFTYDGANHKLTQTDALGHQSAWTYDAVGNQASATDADTNATTFGHDNENELTTVTAPGGAITSYTYDPNGDLLTRTDANNHVTSYAYDAAGRLTTLETPLQRTWAYTYDANGNKATATAPGGEVTTYSHDNNNRLTGVSYSDSTTGVSYSYDANGNRATMTDSLGTVPYTHDNRDRLTAVARGTSAFAYSHDASGRLVERVFPDATTTDYSYDDDGRLWTVTNASRVWTYGYDSAGNQTSLALPTSNGHSESRTYDAAGRLTELKNSTATSTLSQFNYTYDAAGNPTQIVTTAGVERYNYDSRNRIVEACYQASACTGSTDPYIRYAYDGVGNRTSQTTPAGVTSYVYDAGDQLTSETTPSATTNYTYDLRGNETGAGNRSFAFDLANRMTSSTVGGATTSYAYDGDGNRVASSSLSATTNYLWDVNNSLPQLVSETDGSGAALRTYLYGADTLSMSEGGASYYFHYDGLGSVVNVTNGAGQAQWSYSYDPYGNERTTTKDDPSAPTNNLRFTGELLDSTSGLYDLRARMYDPTTGRFLSTDPAPSNTSQPVTDDYAYVDDQPLVGVDPSGAFCWGCILPAIGDGLSADYSYLKWYVENQIGFNHDCLRSSSCMGRAEVGLALLVITPEEKVVTVLGAIARVPGGARLIEGLAKTSWGRKIGRKMLQWSYTAKGSARIGTQGLHGQTGIANSGRIRVGISERAARKGGPVFSVRIDNRHIDFG
jgi:RHS repeat-associated protein